MGRAREHGKAGQSAQQRVNALLMQLSDAAALVAGAGAYAWDALAVGASAPRELLLNVRARVEIATERLREVKGTEVALAAIEDLGGVDVLEALGSSEATLARVARRLHEAAHREWMRLPEPERERLREARDVAAETVDNYLVKREEALGHGRDGIGVGKRRMPGKRIPVKVQEERIAAWIADPSHAETRLDASQAAIAEGTGLDRNQVQRRMDAPTTPALAKVITARARENGDRVRAAVGRPRVSED